ncbi:MAG: hypothetical protein ACI9YE_002142 [Psychroserpens sp.]|jgi:hypothetical protein
MNYYSVLKGFAIYHEVGHFLVAQHLGIEINYVRLDDEGSHISVNTYSFNKLSLEEKICFYMAGEAGFDLFKDLDLKCKTTCQVYDDYKKTHAKDDHEKITNIVSKKSYVYRVPFLGKWVLSKKKIAAQKRAYNLLYKDRTRLKTIAYKLALNGSLTP